MRGSHHPIREYRLRFGLSQKDLGKLCKCDRSTICQIERGWFLPGLKLAVKLKRITGVSVDRIANFRIEPQVRPHKGRKAK